MKRYGNLWPQVIAFANLYGAARQASRGKRHLATVAPFLFDLERHLCVLQDELRARVYTPGPYRTFTIFEPKQRQISAAPFRDRVVHHALCRVIEPIFERSFIPDSYACRRGKGTHAAVRRCTSMTRRFDYVLKCDVRKYFPSIDHAILKGLIARKIKDPDVMWLVEQLVDGSNLQESAVDWFASEGDDLFAPLERRRGLPLGNQTSQFFANVYLDRFDHFVKEVLLAPGYIRYVDDFVLFHDDKRWLAWAWARCAEFLAGLRLRLHPTKCALSRTADGIRFLGYRVFRTHRLLPRANVVKLRRRLRELEAGYARGEIDWANIRRRLAGWLGHAQQADTWRLRTAIFGDTIFKRNGRD